MRSSTFAIAYAVFAVFIMPVPSSADSRENALPIYPRSHYPGAAPQRPMDETLAAAAVLHGDFAHLATKDSPQTVARWYRARLPKTCVRQDFLLTGARFTCRIRAVSIVKMYGETSIVLGPIL